MAKEEMLEFRGEVIECLPSASFRIRLETETDGEGPEIIATISGRMRKNNIRVLLGDKVSIEMSAYDLTKGRITFRHK